MDLQKFCLTRHFLEMHHQKVEVFECVFSAPSFLEQRLTQSFSDATFTFDSKSQEF